MSKLEIHLVLYNDRYFNISDLQNQSLLDELFSKQYIKNDCKKTKPKIRFKRLQEWPG